MNDDSYELSARDYLLKAAEGEKFEYREPKFADGYEDGPFGDYAGVGMSWVGLHDEEVFADYESGLASLKNLAPGKVCKLYFEEDSKYQYSNLDLTDDWKQSLLIATPRDPQGPFTVSVYQEFEFCGWLTGEGLEEFAIHLVETSDYGAKLVSNSILSRDEAGEIFLKYLILEDLYICEMKPGPSRISSPALVPPSQLEWENGEEVYPLKRGVTWDSIDDVVVSIDNPEFLKPFNLDEVDIWFDGTAITFVPDIWEPERKSVFVFWDDVLVGRMNDNSESEQFFNHFTEAEHSIGTSEKGYIYLDEEDGKHYLAVSAAVRPLARVDWDLAAEGL